MTVTNPHLAPPMPIWGVVGHNIDRCIINSTQQSQLWTEVAEVVYSGMHIILNSISVNLCGYGRFHAQAHLF